MGEDSIFIVNVEQYFWRSMRLYCLFVHVDEKKANPVLKYKAYFRLKQGTNPIKICIPNPNSI